MIRGLAPEEKRQACPPRFETRLAIEPRSVADPGDLLTAGDQPRFQRVADRIAIREQQ